MKQMKVLLALFFLFAGSCDLFSQSRDLNYYQQLALNNSPLLKDYQGQGALNKLDSLISRAALGPQLNISSTAAYTPQVNGWGYDGANSKSYNALLSLSKTIVGGKNVKTQMAAFDLERQSLATQSRVSEKDLRLAVTTQYISTYAIWQEILFNEQVVELLTQERAILKTLTENSVYKQTDYLSFEVSLQQQHLLIVQLKSNYSNNTALLNYICGAVDTLFVELPSPEIRLYTSTSFESTAQFQKLQIDSLKLVNSDKLIDYQYRPSLSMFADAGYSSTLILDPYKNFGASVGLTLTIPIFDGKQKSMLHSKIRASEQIRRNYQNFENKQYQQQIAQLYQQLHQTEGVIEQARGVIKYSRTLTEAYRKQLSRGEVSITDYIISVNNDLNTQHVITQNENAKLQIINQINYWRDE